MRASGAFARYDNARNSAGVIRFRSQAGTVSAVVVAGCNARNIRPVETDIGKFAIGKLGQFSDIALIFPERPDHADEREQHGSLLKFMIQPLGDLIIEMNIEECFAAQKFLCCAAAKRNLHGLDKEELTSSTV